MAAAPQTESTKLSHARYAAELRLASGVRRFSPPIEEEYLRSRLQDNAILIRMACILAFLLAGRHSVELLVGEPLGIGRSIVLAALLIASAALAVLAWGSALQRYYLPAARILVPFRNSLGAVGIAWATLQGQLEALMALPLMIIGPFFFLGLRYRVALLSAIATLTSFSLAALMLDVPTTAIVRSCTMLVTAMLACAVAAWHVEGGSRKSFLEGRLIAQLAERDALTGLKNRRIFDEQSEWLWEQGIAEGRTLAMLLIDVDHFKVYNDLYGHQAGDRALRRVARAIESSVTNASDIIVRYGGEEFAAILYNVDGRQAEALAQRMRRAVEDLAIEHRGSRGTSAVTISVGVAVVDPSRERRARGALQLADQALYEAKTRGRNQVVLKDQAAHGMLVTGVFAMGSVTQR